MIPFLVRDCKFRGISPRGEGTLIFSCIRRACSFFGVQILNFNTFWVFRKINIFWGMKTLWIFLGGHHKIGLYLGVISMHFMVFSEGQGTEWGIFLGGAKSSNIFWGV